MTWLSWPIWGFISTIATVLSLVAIVIALVDIAHRRHQFPAGLIRIAGYGFGVDEKGKFDAVEVSNSGRSALVITTMSFVNCKPASAPSLRARWHLAGGESFDLGLRSNDYSKAWILIGWISDADKRFLHVTWHPYLAGTELDELLDAQTDERIPLFKRAPALTKRSGWRRVREVGPNGSASSVVRYTRRKHRKLAEDAMDVAFGGLPADAYTISSRTMKARSLLTQNDIDGVEQPD